MKRPRIIKSQTKELISIPHPAKLPEFEPIIDPNGPKIYPNESPVSNMQKELIETLPYSLAKSSEFSIKELRYKT